MKKDQLSGAKSKIERANANILDVKAEIERFFANPPPHYRVFREVNADGTREALKLEIIREPADQIVTAVGDVVTNLRSALDFLTCELAIQNGVNDLSGIEFPFADGPEKFMFPGTQRKIQKLSTDAIDLVRSQKPYKGGNDLLWAMNIVRRPNVHRHLIVSAITINQAGGHIRFVAPTPGLHTFEQPAPWKPADREITMITFTPHAKLEYEVQVGMDITIRDVEPIEGQSVLAVLQQFSDLTARILGTFEDRFFRT